MDFHNRQTLELIGLIYDAVADASRWPAFLGAFASAVGACGGTLALRPPEGKEFWILCWAGYTDDDVQVYVERYAAIDPWTTTAARQPEGCVMADPEFCPRPEMEASAAFREFYAPRNYLHGMGGIIQVKESGQSAISVTRNAEAGPFGETEKDVLRPLMPHLKRAATLHGELGLLRRKVEMLTDHLDRYPHAFFLTDPDCRVLYANAAARELSLSGDGPRMEHGRLSLCSSGENAALRQAVQELSAQRGEPLRRLVVRSSQGRPYRLIVMPAKDMGAIALSVSLPAVSILAVMREMRTEADVPLLRDLFSLTPAEARVAGKLAIGQSVEEIATEEALSLETVRTHVKRALAKTGTERQGELISLILRSAPVRRTQFR